MTDQHPLTDEICQGLVHFFLDSRHDYIEMRAAANWQLEQVLEWLKTNTEDYVLEDYYSTYFLIEAFLDDFEKAMRPQQQEDN
jgi:hypothetical protein